MSAQAGEGFAGGVDGSVDAFKGGGDAFGIGFDLGFIDLELGLNVGNPLPGFDFLEL